MIKAIDTLVLPFTPHLLNKLSWDAKDPDTSKEKEISPIKSLDEYSRGHTPRQYIDLMNELGIERSLVAAAKLGTIFHAPSRLIWDVSVQEVKDIIDEGPDKFCGLYGINPLTRMDGVREMEMAVREYGFVGAYIHCYEFGPINDKMWYPFYTKCIELDIPVTAQIGHSGGIQPSANGRPILVDDIACDLPELKFVASHTGWPWVEEMVAVAWKHPNVYIGTGGHMPKYWDPSLLRFINTRGKNKVMWGSDVPFFDVRKMIAQIEELGLQEEVKAKLLRENAVQLFKL